MLRASPSPRTSCAKYLSKTLITIIIIPSLHTSDHLPHLLLFPDSRLPIPDSRLPTP
ncbi:MULTISPECIES: hypothetical protein [Moorena]|uniref:hypothetical protein n=1 Tax=Moorena TaxID=1155738 RepID=UPI00030D0309|nr:MULTISPECIES: hypothetical protein [Moorena]NEP69085.1 hypothetical protein [Moorena sp. SIO3A5]NEQ12131.1 hypothetical protein [Moorena sp. SIO4E2]NER90976.1 hypothetical protein [Moorena sp. SIO3A2]NES42080.1 hypothetical protein [Moorena sp. SIO2C4]